MQVSIHVASNLVVIDGIANEADCAALAGQNIHAVQWRDDHGEVEFKSVYLPAEKREHRTPNQHITDFTEFQSYVDAWLDQEKIKQPEIARQRLAREKDEASLRKNEDRMRATFDGVTAWRRPPGKDA